MTPTQCLADARRLLDKLKAARRDLWLLTSTNLDAVGIGDDDAQTNLIAAIDAFTSGTFVRLEQRALAGEPGAACKLRNATANILAAVEGVDPVGDWVENVGQTVRDTVRDLGELPGSAGVGIGIAAAGLALLLLALRR